MEKITVKLAAGRRVRDPLTRQPLPGDPVTVDDGPFWRRRLTAGDVVSVSPPAARRSRSLPEEG